MLKIVTKDNFKAVIILCDVVPFLLGVQYLSKIIDQGTQCFMKCLSQPSQKRCFQSTRAWIKKSKVFFFQHRLRLSV